MTDRGGVARGAKQGGGGLVGRTQPPPEFWMGGG